jgi:hypothetical protein
MVIVAFCEIFVATAPEFEPVIRAIRAIRG